MWHIIVPQLLFIYKNVGDHFDLDQEHTEVIWHQSKIEFIECPILLSFWLSFI